MVYNKEYHYRSFDRIIRKNSTDEPIPKNKHTPDAELLRGRWMQPASGPVFQLRRFCRRRRQPQQQSGRRGQESACLKTNHYTGGGCPIWRERKGIRGRLRSVRPEPSANDGDHAVEEPASVEEWKAVLSFEQAKRGVTVHASGANKGKTLGELCLSHMRAVHWVAGKYTGNNHKAKAAAQILIEAGEAAAKADQNRAPEDPAAA